MAVWLLARGLGIEAPLLFHLIAVPIIEVIALVPISFNGIGLREGAYVFLYAQIGVAPEAALALSLAWTLLLLTFSLVGGLCWLWPGLYDAGRTHAKRGADR
jgi:glycosyltransferase 2 family protein